MDESKADVVKYRGWPHAAVPANSGFRWLFPIMPGVSKIMVGDKVVWEAKP
jgi:hypothetical protein